MKGERRLSLVKPPPSDGGGSRDEEALSDLDVTPEELREAEALRRSMERGDDPFAEALRAAHRPSALDAGDLDAILARAMGDLDAAPTRAEAEDADRLRVALDEHDAERAGQLVRGPGAKAAPRDDSAAVTAVALRAAWAPTPIGATRNEALISRALEASAAANTTTGGGAANDGASKRGNPIEPAPLSLRRFRIQPRTIAGMTAVVAMAAGVMLLLGRLGTSSAPPPSSVAQAPAAAATAVAMSPSPSAPRIAARSTQEMFDAATPFPRSGGESERVDRIAAARASDLRANRFAAWGVR
ncbi:MAG: hypothetical protein U0441_00520 [Polyangiaceae bacterium]